MTRRTTYIRIVSALGFAFGAGVVLLSSISCGEGSDVIEAERTKIKSELNRQHIYERSNLPDPEPATLNGYYDVVNGAYRHIINEDREGRNNLPLIAAGDSIAFMFDARIFTGNFDSSKTFYTNILSRIPSNNTGDFDPEYWPTVPLRIKVSDDSKILKAIQLALIGCRATPERTETDEQEPGDETEEVPDESGEQEEEEVVEEEAESDQTRIYLTSDIAFGNKSVYNVPGGSTLVFELTGIEIIR